MSAEPKDAHAIFRAAAAKPAPAERTAFLDEACGGDAALRRRVEDLLRAHAGPGSPPDLPAVEGGTLVVTPPACADSADSSAPPFADPTPRPVEGPGARVGHYKLLQPLGEGGMGTVYLAEQTTEPVRRRVALKVIRPGLDSREVIARFEAERQALALMDHPHIAKVLDAGTTEAGRPFFAMELVPGLPLTEYCDRNRLTPHERLGLFIPVCRAVQHAHQKGVIHRDLKPSNVLVTLADGRPVAKVIDFGVAKAAGPRLTDQTLVTQHGAVVGTPQYMAPEQAGVSALGVDTRSDIYSLGVLLYELLAGSTPLERERLRQAGLEEVLRVVREEEPPKPSTRLSTAGARLAAVAAARRTEPAKLAKLVRGELDWIVMKCLEKYRTRRYETADRAGAGEAHGAAGPRPPPHAHRHEQPGRGVPGRREAGPGPGAARRGAAEA
jgi:serine/threonine protein kinase